MPITVPIPTAAAMLGVSRSSIYELIRAQRIDRVKVGRRSLITVASLRGLAEGHL